jgi:hypothetical protein
VRVWLSAAANLESKDEQITAIMTHQEREKKMLQEKLEAVKEAEASIQAGLGTKDQQIAELKKAAAENEVECIICIEEFDKSDTNQWRMMIPCCHVFCSKCVDNPECKLATCPNCSEDSKGGLQAKIGGFISDDAVTGHF